MGVAGGLRPPA